MKPTNGKGFSIGGDAVRQLGFCLGPRIARIEVDKFCQFAGPDKRDVAQTLAH